METAQMGSGAAPIVLLMQKLETAGLADSVTFMTLNVFGRTIGPGNTDGRQHNENHQVSITIGKPFKGGIVGGVVPVQKDYGALAIDSKTGEGSSSVFIAALDTLPSYGLSMPASLPALPPVIAT